MTGSGTFFERLASLTTRADSFDAQLYAPAPDDWLLAVTDVESSTRAVEQGRYQLVNLAGAAGIAAVKNACRGTEVPFLFGGDGAVVLIPPEHVAAARAALAATCSFVVAAYGMKLRAGAMTVGEIRRHGCDVRVARYEPSPGNCFGLFLGGGAQLVERAIKGREPAIPMAHVEIPADPAAGTPDLTGLSCRWSPLKSVRGKMVSIIVTGARDPRAVYDRIVAIADPEGAGINPVRPETLTAKWPPRTLVLEARSRGGRLPLALRVALLALETLLVWIVIKRNRPVGPFDPTRYKNEMARNLDFSKYDDTLAMVIDCQEDRIAAIRAYLDEPCARGELSYGIHLSDSALMTCLVESATEHRHVHFIDGDAGGYTQAAKELKQRVAAQPDARREVALAAAGR
ncbi:MAG TPA: DUF3095 domain-containing protein [Candidatus Sulfotelmatobacter sp.]|nr:DUF3095 domain-containing protein [Candidatus Sulfotelmatobacter sp.]